MINWLGATISAVFAGASAILVSLCIEKFGGAVGGILGTAPTTIVPASIGFLYTMTDYQMFIDSMFTVTSGMLLNTIFLYMWQIIPPKLPRKYASRTRLFMMLGISLTGWFFIAIGYVFFTRWLKKTAGVSSMIVGGTAFVLQLLLGLIAVFLTPVPAPKGKNKVSRIVLLARASLASTAIFIGNLLSNTSGIAAGLATVFPSIYITTMVSVWWAQGEAVSSGAVGPMMLGSLAVGAYAMVITQVRPYVGIFGGAAISYLTAVICVSLPIMFLMRWRQKKTQEQEENATLSPEKEESMQLEERLLEKGVEHEQVEDDVIDEVQPSSDK